MSSIIQGTLVAAGVGTLIVQNQLIFETIRWLGVAYLAYLGITSLIAACKRRMDQDAPEANEDSTQKSATAVSHVKRGLFQGFVTNITNPKMFVFYLSLLPQFVPRDAALSSWLMHAWALPVIGTACLIVVALAASFVREKLLRPVVQRALKGISGLAFLGFGAKLATDH